jgi:acyl-CoA synthetase (AMP-forming)/AMP-acid ligase II
MDGITDRAFVEPPLGACDSGSCRWIDTEWVLATSGTTATPKLVVHSLASLMRAVKAGDRYHGYRWGLVYDVARFAGLQVALQAAASGTRLLVADPEASLDEQVAWLASERCNALSATPTLWRRLLMTVGVGKLPLRQITLGGEIADLGVLRALAARFPAAHITHVYASTEAGVGFAVHDALPGFPARWLDDANRDVRLRIGEDGCLWVLSRRRDYDADPLYLGETRAGIVNDGWINTGDLVERRDGRVYFLGRLNGSINVGGNKVFPEMVEAFIREVDGVEAVLVRGKPSSVMGNLVEALVKPGPSVVDVQSLVRQVKEHCKARLADYQRPAFVRIVEGLGISATGKLER